MIMFRFIHVYTDAIISFFMVELKEIGNNVYTLLYIKQKQQGLFL